MRKIKKGRDDMDFLKTLFEAGALTWEQFSRGGEEGGLRGSQRSGGRVCPQG